jgi:hypothetical protein
MRQAKAKTVRCPRFRQRAKRTVESGRAIVACMGQHSAWSNIGVRSTYGCMEQR